MTKVGIKNIIFDLDGTLVDSINGIQDAFQQSYAAVFGVESNHNIREHIGPPIINVLKTVHGDVRLEEAETFLNRFFHYYDKSSYRKTEMYENLVLVLDNLRTRGKQLFVATNKRLLPTNLILAHLGIDRYFEEVYCIDSHDYRFENKAIMLETLIGKHSLIKSQTLMVGDTIHDYEAAKDNDVRFAFVDYGYGEVKHPDYRINNIEQLLTIL